MEGSNRMFVDGNGDLRAQAQVTSAGLAGAFDILLNMRLHWDSDSDWVWDWVDDDDHDDDYVNFQSVQSVVYVYSNDERNETKPYA